MPRSYSFNNWIKDNILLLNRFNINSFEEVKIKVYILKKVQIQISLGNYYPILQSGERYHNSLANILQ